MVVGIDPGYRNTGVALISGRRVVASFTVQGKGPASPFHAVAAGAFEISATVVRRINEAWCELDAVEPLELVALEGWQFQGPGRAQQAATTAQVAQAIYGAVRTQWPVVPIRIDYSGNVLDPKGGYGRLKSMLTAGRASSTCDWRLNDHEASAACHALWADARARQGALL